MDRGEFETVPRVAAPAKKGGKGAVILAIVFALIAAGLGVWLAILLLNQPKSNSSSTNGGSDSVATVSERNEDEVLNLLDEIQDSLTTGGYGFERFYSDSGLPIKVNDSLWVESARSYGATVQVYSDSDNNANKMRNNAVNVLKQHGLKSIIVPIFGNGDIREDTGYFEDSTTGTYCHVGGVSEVQDDYSWFTYECSNKKWLTEESKQLAINLASAYNNSEVGKNYKLDFIGETLSRLIKKNSTGTYEHITVDFADSVGLFYRKVGGEWKYFTGTQQIISCSKYDTDELKEAYKGTRCWDDKTNAYSNL